MELIHLKSLLNKRGESARLSKATNISTGNISDWLNPSKIEDIITDYIPDNAVFGIHIKGKSMEDTIPDDSVVLLDTKFDPYELDGQNVIAEINGDVICKQYNQQSDHIWFKSLNREFSHEDRYIYDNNYRIIGKIVKIIL